MSKHDAATALETAKTTLHKPASTLADLVAASAATEQVARDAARALEAELAARERTLAGSGTAIALEAALRAHDVQIGDLRRRGDIARATAAALIRRIDEMQAAEAVREQLEFYHATQSLRSTAAAMIAPALEEMGAIARQLMRALAEAELAVVRANKNLPPGAERLASVESHRLVKPPEPSAREIRRGRFYVEEGSGRILGPETQFTASLRPDKKFDVILPGGATSGGIPTVASLQELVEIETTEYPSRGWPEQLSLSLRIPGFSVADPDWWSIATDRNAPAFPDEVINRLDKLENRAPAEPLPPRVSIKTIPVARWDSEQTPASKAA